MKRTGILLDERGFVRISAPVNGKTGGIEVGDTLQQNEYLILMPQKGEIKEDPLMGAAIGDMVNDNDLLAWRWQIAEELARDGITVRELNIDGYEIDITADYED